jgi:hypothetical protein
MRWPLMFKKTHRRAMNALARANTAALTLLGEKYVRVQYGYDQGVLEGKRQGYVNVRAHLADLMVSAPLLRAPLVQVLGDLGEEETRLLDKMKGIDRDAINKQLAAQLGDDDAVTRP